MTNIYLHGILADQFPQFIPMALRKASEVVSAIDAIHDGFRLAQIKLASMGIHYGIIVDGSDIKSFEEGQMAIEPREIHLVPIICGSGPAAAAIAVGGMLMAGAGALTTGGGILAGILTAGQVAGFGAMIAGIGLQMLLAPKPDIPRPESVVSGLQESSFIASNSANLMTQGSPLPIGYGRLRVGSSIINATTKSFQVSKKQRNSMLSNTSGKIGADVQISTKQGKKSR